MNSEPQPPPLPPPPSGQWAYPTDEQGNPKKKYILWLVFGAAGCVVLVLGVGLAVTVLVPQLFRRHARAQQAEARAELHDLREALEVYAEVNRGRYPDSLEALVTPDAQGHTLLRDARELPRDPWGRPYRYDPPGAGRAAPRLSSLGRDGEPGGSGADEDLIDER